MAIDQSAKTILVTSSNPSEGKSVTVANLGVTMAQAFLKTVIVDSDLRQPSIHKIFGTSNQAGLTNLIVSREFEIDDYLQDTGIENLQVITSGPLPPNPAELLGSQRMIELLQRLEERADVIIFDSPPVLAVTDTVILSSQVDGVILVAKAKRTRRDSIRESMNRLQQVGARLLGCVLNQVPGHAGYYHYYSYSQVGSGPGDARQTNGVDREGTPRRSWLQRLNIF
jgi:capsular exopolysaccharide synthesis family protein